MLKLSTLIDLFSGKFGNAQELFFLMATRSSFGQFQFELRVINKTNFPNFNFNSDYKDLTQHGCLTARFNNKSQELDILLTNCFEQHLIFCRKVHFVKPNCSKTVAFTNLTAFSIMLNTSLKLNYQQAIAYQKYEVIEMFKRLDLEKAYKSIYESLWYSFVPCFDVGNISQWFRDMSLIRYCEWRGIPVACSEIFTTFPTDKGLCCSFNMKAANDIYRKSLFRDVLEGLQNYDKMNALIPILPSKTFTPSKKPQAGSNRGLKVLLDAHSDWLYPGSYDEEFHAFTAVIQSRESFPLMNQGGLLIRPGHHSTITLTSYVINADDSIKSLKEEDRNCLFPVETIDLKLHKKYSYANCKFECSYSYAKFRVYNQYGTTCQPWFFPMGNKSSMICDPWISSDFFQIMSMDIPDSQCSHCLPDCNSTFYDSSVVAVPFENCNSGNLGVSQFCQLLSEQPMVNRVIYQIIKEFIDISNASLYLTELPGYLTTSIDSSRSYGYNIFNKTPLAYQTFERDIASVEIIYQKAILVQIESQITMTWIDYFSIVGGLFGLVLGMGFYTFFDVLWLCLRILSKYFKLTNWIA